MVSVKLAEIGVLTPPVGLNVFVVKSSSPVPVTLGQAFTGVMPFIALDFLSLGLYVAFPEMILWLPNLMSCVSKESVNAGAEGRRQDVFRPERRC